MLNSSTFRVTTFADAPFRSCALKSIVGLLRRASNMDIQVDR